MSSNRRRNPLGFHVGDELIVKRGAGALLGVRGRRLSGLAQLGEALIERRSAKAGQFREQQVAQGRARGFGEIIGCGSVDARPESRFRLFDQGRKHVLEGASLGLIGRSSRFAARALQRSFDPDCAVDPGRRGHGGATANPGKPRQDLSDRQMIALQPLLKQRPVAGGRGPAPCGQALRRRIGVVFPVWQWLKVLGQEFVDGRSAN